jgi:dienelactone hydrolase
VADAVRAAKKPFVDVEFSQAVHAFFIERTDRYHAPSAALAWAMTLAFLAQHLPEP